MFSFPYKLGQTKRLPFLSSTTHLEILIFDVLKGMGLSHSLNGVTGYTFILVRIRTLPEFKGSHYRQCVPLALLMPPSTAV